MAIVMQSPTIFTEYIKNYHQRLQAEKVVTEITARYNKEMAVSKSPINSHQAWHLIQLNGEIKKAQLKRDEVLSEKLKLENFLHDQFLTTLEGKLIRHITDIYPEGIGNNNPQQKEVLFEKTPDGLQITFSSTGYSLM